MAEEWNPPVLPFERVMGTVITRLDALRWNSEDHTIAEGVRCFDEVDEKTIWAVASIGSRIMPGGWMGVAEVCRDKLMMPITLKIENPELLNYFEKWINVAYERSFFDVNARREWGQLLMEFSIKATPTYTYNIKGAIALQFGSLGTVKLSSLFERIIYIKPGVVRIGMNIPLP